VAVTVAFLSDKAAVPSDTIKGSPSLLIYSSAIQSRKKQNKAKLSLGVNKHCPVKICERMEVQLHTFLTPTRSEGKWQTLLSSHFNFGESNAITPGKLRGLINLEL
jgi:hypothetical protein